MANELIPSNSNKYHEGQNKKKEKKVRQVTSGSVKTRPRSPGRKFFHAFFNSDARTLKEYLVEDQLIPSMKEIALRTFEMWLFGDSARSSSSESRSRGWTEKTQYNKAGRTARNSSSRNSEKSRALAKFNPEIDDIFMETRGDAERTLEYLQYLISEYDEVTVSDLYESVGKTADWSLSNVGWRDLGDAFVQHTRYGWRLELPSVEQLD